MLLYLKNCGRGIDYKMEKSQKIEKMTNLMTSQSDDDVIGATSNLSEDTCQSIIFHIWGRSCLYLIRCCLNNSHKMCAKISCIYLSIYLSIYQSQKQSLYPRAPLKSLENPIMFGSSFWTWDCHHRIPRKILGRNSGLSFVLAQK